MSDIATVWDVGRAVGDWQVSPATSLIWVDEHGNSVRDQNGQPIDAIFTPGTGLVSGQDLYTAVLISLFTDAAAGPDDVIPDGSGDPRGWWGDPTIGSKLWLRLRRKADATTAALVKRDIEQALAWLVADDVAASVTVAVSWFGRNRLGSTVTIARRDGALAALSFARVWDGL